MEESITMSAFGLKEARGFISGVQLGRDPAEGEADIGGDGEGESGAATAKHVVICCSAFGYGANHRHVVTKSDMPHTEAPLVSHQAAQPQNESRAL